MWHGSWWRDVLRATTGREIVVLVTALDCDALCDQPRAKLRHSARDGPRRLQHLVPTRARDAGNVYFIIKTVKSSSSDDPPNPNNQTAMHMHN